ncbi:hypothetical protein WJX74_003433 [Apatococcus lobatus]|uniref:Uncharacterized protein n=1 Tax=Apatococcus lobatus TaxID=904363 RepID=A0AAW1S6B2_9CHLO
MTEGRCATALKAWKQTRAVQAFLLLLWHMSSPDEAPEYADLSRHDGGLWQQAGSITFIIYMVIGFSATMGLIVLVVGGYMFIRRCCCLARQPANHLPQEGPATEGSDNLPMFNSEPAFLVVNPGGMHNIAFQENESCCKPDMELTAKRSTAAANDVPAAITFKTGHHPARQESSLIKAVYASSQAHATAEGHGSQIDIELAQLRQLDQRGADDLTGSKLSNGT